MKLQEEKRLPLKTKRRQCRIGVVALPSPHLRESFLHKEFDGFIKMRDGRFCQEGSSETDGTLFLVIQKLLIEVLREIISFQVGEDIPLLGHDEMLHFNPGLYEILCDILY